MSQRETQQMGSIPLQTLQAKVDYGYATRTTYGAIGVRVWVHVGGYGEGQEAVEGQRRRGRSEGAVAARRRRAGAGRKACGKREEQAGA